jgi:hypothetical protein
MNPDPSRLQVLDTALDIAGFAGISPDALAVVYAPDAHSLRVLHAISAARSDPWAGLPASAAPARWSIFLCTIDAARAAFGRTSVTVGQGPRFFVFEGDGLRVREIAPPSPKNTN